MPYHLHMFYIFFSANVGEDTKRVKMFLTTSKLEYANYGEAVQQLKKRLNLPTENYEDPLGFLRNTCMEPYQASEAYVQILGEMFRKTVLTCIGAVSKTIFERISILKLIFKRLN